MYTLKNAARVLGVSVQTVRSWIVQDRIETTVIETDRKRIYLAYNDVLALADKHRPLRWNGTDQEQSSQELEGLYSVQEVARMLGVQYKTLHEWIVSSGVEKKMITTDRKRSYISYSDLVTLADKHNCTIPCSNLGIEQKTNNQEDSRSQGEKLYTMAEAALFLGVSADTVNRWSSLHNIEKKTVETDRRHAYITYNDIIMLASKHRREDVYPVDMVANMKEVRYRLEKIEEGILNLEKYIKRSVYLGK